MKKWKWNTAYKARLDDLIQHIDAQMIPGTPERAQEAAFNNLLEETVRTLQAAIEEGFDE